MTQAPLGGIQAECRFLVHVTNGDFVPKFAAYSPPSQGGATAPKARSGRLVNVVSTLLIRCASRKSIMTLRDFERTAPPAPPAPGCPAFAKAGNSPLQAYVLI